MTLQVLGEKGKMRGTPAGRELDKATFPGEGDARFGGGYGTELRLGNRKGLKKKIVKKKSRYVGRFGSPRCGTMA